MLLITYLLLGASSKCKTRQRSEGSAMQKTNENDVLKIVDTMESDWCNPFDVQKIPASLINICTGKEVTPEIENSLLKFIDDNQSNTIDEVSRCDVTNFWKPRKKGKILTFKENNIKAKAIKDNYIIGSELMFRRILCAAQINEMDLSNILSHELTLVPMALFHEDGSMRKTVKSDLIKKIEDSLNTQDECPFVQSVIVDGMVMVQEMNEKQFVSFNDLGKVFWQNALQFGRRCHALRITIVFDTYKSHSIKEGERIRRGVRPTAEFNISGNRKIHKFRDFLKSWKNKLSLLHFLTQYIIDNHGEFLKDNEALLIAGGFENPEKVVLLSKNQEEKTLDDLYSTHEEADTRIILHMIYEAQLNKNILIKSVDTDVLLLLIHFYSSRPTLQSVHLYMLLGHYKNKRVISVGEIVQNLGKKICSCLLSVHCLTGCDTTNAFFKIGKKTAFEVLKKNIDFLEPLSKLPLLPQTDGLQMATQFVLFLYKNKDSTIQTLNDLRLRIATQTNKPSSELPPTDGAFYQHFLRLVLLH